MRNLAILQAGLVDNGLITIVILYSWVTGALSSVFIGLSGFFTGMFFLLFLLLMPRGEKLQME
jgi:hypothetical protein